MTKPTEQEPDRSTPDRTGSAYGTSQPAPVWDGAVAGRDESIGDPGTSSSDRASSGGASFGGRGPAGDPESGADGVSSGGPDDGGSGSAGSGRGTGSGSGTGSNGGLTGGANGRTDEAPPRLPPPWERVPAGGAESAATARLGGSGAASGGPSADRYGSTPRSGAPSATVTEDPDRDSDARDSDARDSGSRDSGSRDSGARRPVSPELGDARTTEVDSRSIWTGQPNPPPGGFPAGWPRNRRPRQANLQLKRLDPWSVLKIALVLAVVLYLVWMVAVGVLYGALDGIGVWDRLNGQYADLVSEGAGDKLISAIRVFGVAAVVGAVNSLLVAVAFSVSAFIYNVSADLVGGIEVTLSERD